MLLALLHVVLAGSPPSAEASSPASIVGQPAPPWTGVRWVANVPSGGLRPADLAGRVLVVFLFQADRDVGLAALADTVRRWWTNGCPHCAGSLPALARLEGRYQARGLRVVAVYHPKGRPLGDLQAQAVAQRLSFPGVLAFDDRWAKYLELRERGNLRKATSISVLVDAEGVIRWVHRGPRLFERGDPERDGTAALAELDRLVGRLLPPPPAPARAPGGR
jgi:thiol-disulfide isomerase/thioredoxin